jgi:hypothetical protein
VVRVQKIKVPDTGRLSWIVIDGEHIPVGVVNEYLTYLHRLGRSPNTVRAYAHHLQAYWAFLVEQKHDWRKLKLNQLAEFVSWVRHATRAGGRPSFRCNYQFGSWLQLGRSTTIRTGLEWKRRSAAPAVSVRRVLISRSCTISAEHNRCDMLWSG